MGLNVDVRLESLNSGKMDILIARTILANGHHEIVTNNITHYELIPDLKIYTY
jgi:predicted nucleic acid-binding protein